MFARLVDICDQLRQCHALNVRDFLQVIPEGIFKANAGRDKPSYGIVATADRALNPTLARWMYKRSGAKITEIKASHLVYIAHPRAVANVIERAARSIRENTTKRQ